MEADDDGFVEAFGVIRKTGATEEDLRILIDRGFITAINEDLLCYIPAWLENNQIRKDRYTASIYHELLEKLKSGIPFGNQVATNGIPTVDQAETQYRLGKNSVGKGSIESTADEPPSPTKPPKKCHGEFGWVKLTDEEYNRLLNDLGETEVKRCITYIDEAAQTTGNKNKWRDWNLVVRKCSKQGWGLNQRFSQKKPGSHEHSIDRLARLYEEEFQG